MKHGMYDATNEPMQKPRFDYVSLFIGLGAVILMGRGIWSFIPERQPVKIISPVPETTPTPTITPTPTQKPTTGQHTGIASYYSRAGCVGCSKTLTMANGEPLDDTKVTAAYNRAPLNHFVDVTNVKNGTTVRVKVTDRGGFERLGRVIDLSVAAKTALGCTDLCHVTVTKGGE